MHGWGYGMGMWPGMGWMWIGSLLLLAVVIAVAVWIGVRANPGRSRPETPEETLRQRLARGDIDLEDFRQRLAELHR